MKKDGLKLYCFSPPVMIATFIIELLLLAYIVIRYRMTSISRVIATALALLATFQLAEYNVCGDSPAAVTWSRIGFAAITLLPAVGIHLITVISKQRKWKWLVWLAYSTSAAFALFFGLGGNTFAGHVCAGNYVVFQLTATAGGAFFAYYYAWLFIGICMCLYFCINATQKIKEALVLQVFGYLIFLLPTAVVNTVNPQTISGLPSIMCGFAVLYALILAFGIAPRILIEKLK